MFQNKSELTDFINIEDWQKIQDSVSEVAQVTLRTFSPAGQLLCAPSRLNRLCEEILPKLANDTNHLSGCGLQAGIKNFIKNNKNNNLKCHFGMDAFIIQIEAISGHAAAYMIIGPIILNNRKSVSEYSKEAQGLGIKPEDAMDTLIEINVFNYTKIDSIIRLARNVFNNIAQAGYHKKRLGEIAPEILELDPLFSRYYEEKILNSLLNSCTLALDADSGSVMTLDKKTSMLHIKAASRLDEDIINNTNIKLGDGIAGIAAATSRSIILPKDKDKNGLYRKMRRKYIKSSMVIPFNKGATHDVYGVVNLNIVRKEVEFSEKDINLVKEMINMASVALAPLGDFKDNVDSGSSLKSS